MPEENNFLERERKIAIGDVVTFSYENVSQRNIPLDPKICRVRHDARREDVVANVQRHQGKIAEERRGEEQRRRSGPNLFTSFFSSSEDKTPRFGR